MKMEQLVKRFLRLEKRQEQFNELVKSALKEIETNQTDILALSQLTTEKIDDQARRIDEIQSRLIKFFSDIKNSAIPRYLFRKFDFNKPDKEVPHKSNN